MSQKIENLLNISLDATVYERERSLNLDVGYDAGDNTWELIVKYSASPGFLRDKYKDTYVEELLGGYAVIVTPQENIISIAAEQAIDYIEMPKSLYFGLSYGKLSSCIYEGARTDKLSGEGIITAIIDSGIDILNPEFQNPDRTTRIINIWDQNINGGGQGIIQGYEYNREEINEAVIRGERIAYDPGRHGSNVALIACGNNGVAYRSDIIVVKLLERGRNAYPRTVEVMRAIDYVIRKAMEYKRPVAINLSFGNNYGAHNGRSILENYIDTVSGIWKSAICIGMGNEASSGIHYSLSLGSRMQQVQFSVGKFQPEVNLQIWKNYADDFLVELISPQGEVAGPLRRPREVIRYNTGDTRVLSYLGEPGPFDVAQELYFDFIPLNDYIEPGLWTINFIPQRIVNGNVNMWLPSSVVLNGDTRFVRTTEKNLTQTIPSVAARAISVGAYDAVRDSYGDFSGRGFVCENTFSKPDIVAPGVNVILEEGTVNERSVTGTSFATPFVTGAAACLMEWGITMGNDPYLYGEKVKAYLIKGARKLPGFDVWPNPVAGWGALCLNDSLP